MVSVADALGSKVVGSTSDGNTTVVTTRGTDDGSSVPTTGAVTVAGVSGSKVVASLGTIVSVKELSPGTVGCRVRVAETSGRRVVGSTG